MSIFVTKYLKTSKADIFCFSNENVQVIFEDDLSELIFKVN